jgi:hypothetical protein
MGQAGGPESASGGSEQRQASEDSLLGSFEERARRRTLLPTLVSIGTALVATVAGLVGNLVADSVNLGRLDGGWRWVPLGLIAVLYLLTVVWTRPSRSRAKVHDIAVDAADAVWTELSLERRAGVRPGVGS